LKETQIMAHSHTNHHVACCGIPFIACASAPTLRSFSATETKGPLNLSQFLASFLPNPPSHHIHSIEYLSTMARLWTRTRSRFNGTTSPSISSSIHCRRLFPTKIDDNNGDDVEALLEFEEILEGIENTVASLPWEIALSSSQDGNTESVLDGNIATRGMVFDEDDNNITSSSFSPHEGCQESTLEMKLCHMMDVLERGLPQCIDNVNDNATEGIFPSDKKYQGVVSVGSLHSI